MSESAYHVGSRLDFRSDGAVEIGVSSVVTRACSAAVFASMLATIAWNSRVLRSDARLGSYRNVHHQFSIQPALMAARRAVIARCGSPRSAWIDAPIMPLPNMPVGGLRSTKVQASVSKACARSCWPLSIRMAARSIYARAYSRGINTIQKPLCSSTDRPATRPG